MRKYPDLQLKFYAKWDTFSTKTDGRTLQTLRLLAYLLKSPMVTKNWKPSRKEAEEGFFIHVTVSFTNFSFDFNMLIYYYFRESKILPLL